ncbi:MAG: energy transducer TonB [Bryobacteraceae bacterium]|nr:energy transducer TonB [Bryobacteraceae bacterium]
MFEQVFVTDTGARIRPGALAASIAGELAVVAAAVLIPLLFTEAIPQLWWRAHLFEPLPPPGRPAAQPPPAPVTPRAAAPTRPYTSATKLFAPVNYPPKPAAILDPDEGSAAGWQGGVPGVPGGTGTPGVPGSPAVEQALRWTPPPIVPAATEAPVEPKEVIPRVRVGGAVQPPVPRSTPLPVYPAPARAARLAGTVKLEIVIGTDGRVHAIRAIQGHPLLVGAAVETVRGWLYEPPRLNGDPVEMVMFVDVHFTLGR